LRISGFRVIFHITGWNGETKRSKAKVSVEQELNDMMLIRGVKRTDMFIITFVAEMYTII